MQLNSLSCPISTVLLAWYYLFQCVLETCYFSKRWAIQQATCDLCSILCLRFSTWISEYKVTSGAACMHVFTALVTKDKYKLPALKIHIKTSDLKVSLFPQRQTHLCLSVHFCSYKTITFRLNYRKQIDLRLEHRASLYRLHIPISSTNLKYVLHLVFESDCHSLIGVLVY